MKVKIDLERCYISGECCYNHPELFRLGEDSRPIVLVDTVDKDLRRHAEEAMVVCPSAAITLEK